MPTPYALVEYKRLRKLGWKASQALHSAKIRDIFTDLEALDLVKFEVKDEDQQYDMSFVDTWNERPSVKERYKKELQERLDREGHNCLVTYYRASEDDPWKHADMCGGFIGDDWKDSGHDFDLMLSAIEMLGRCSDVVLPCFGQEKKDCTSPNCVVRHVMGA